MYETEKKYWKECCEPLVSPTRYASRLLTCSGCDVHVSGKKNPKYCDLSFLSSFHKDFTSKQVCVCVWTMIGFFLIWVTLTKRNPLLFFEIISFLVQKGSAVFWYKLSSHGGISIYGHIFIPSLVDKKLPFSPLFRFHRPIHWSFPWFLILKNKFYYFISKNGR
jgi:hypothetical protein